MSPRSRIRLTKHQGGGAQIWLMRWRRRSRVIIPPGRRDAKPRTQMAGEIKQNLGLKSLSVSTLDRAKAKAGERAGRPVHQIAPNRVAILM